MGLLDSIIGSVLGGTNTNSSGIGNVLSGLLGGGQGAGAGAGGMGGGMGGMAGGLGGLVSQFENAGLGQIAQSWIGNGANHPVSPQQLGTVFGQSQVQDMANQAGMEPGDFLSQLSQHLPNFVNQMTPNGQMPNNGSVDV